MASAGSPFLTVSLESGTNIKDSGFLFGFFGHDNRFVGFK